VHENKWLCDNLPDTNDDICAWSHVISHRNTRILQKPPALLPLFDRFGTGPSPQNGETREVEFRSALRELPNREPHQSSGGNAYKVVTIFGIQGATSFHSSLLLSFFAHAVEGRSVPKSF
jgi:hypothetical protein